MVVHPAHKGAVIAEHSLNLRRVRKLKFFVQITAVLHRPIIADVVVDAAAIGPKPAPWFNKLKKKVGGMMAFWSRARVYCIGEIPCAHLFAEQKEALMEECLIQLN